MLWGMASAVLLVIALAGCGDPNCEDTSTCAKQPSNGGGGSDMGGSGGTTTGQGGTGGGNLLANGSACNAAPECMSMQCIEGLCCDAACAAECASCAIPGSEGSCASLGATTPCTAGVCDGLGACATGAYAWGKTWEPTDTAGIAIDGDGNVVVVGYWLTGQPLSFGESPISALGLQDIYVAKLDPMGDQIWLKSFGVAGPDSLRQPNGMALDDAGNIYVAGSSSGTLDFGDGNMSFPISATWDAFVVKLDPNGNHVWDHRFEDPGGPLSFESIGVSPEGNVVLVGAHLGFVDFGAGNIGSGPDGDVFVVQFDTDGNHDFSFSFGTTGAQRGTKASYGRDGSFAIAGQFEASFNIGPNPLTHVSSEDGFVAKFTDTGSHVWSQRIGTEFIDRPRAISMTSDGGVIVTGGWSNTLDIGGATLDGGESDGYAVKLDENGAFAWAQTIRGQDGDVVQDVAVDEGGNVVLIGSFRLVGDLGFAAQSSMGFNDVFVVKLTADGTPLWHLFAGDEEEDAPLYIAATQNEIVATGWFDQSIGFGGPDLVTGGGDNAFAVKLAP